MTNHIDKMMKTAGCRTIPRGCTNEDVNEHTDYISNDCEGDCIDCTWYDPDEYYPDFTAEKQLEIIKLIGFDTSFSLVINKFACEPTNKYRLTFSEHRGFKFFQSFNIDFTQALAQLTTELINAGELDKEKVKGILEG